MSFCKLVGPFNVLSQIKDLRGRKISIGPSWRRNTEAKCQLQGMVATAGRDGYGSDGWCRSNRDKRKLGISVSCPLCCAQGCMRCMALTICWNHATSAWNWNPRPLPPGWWSWVSRGEAIGTYNTYKWNFLLIFTWLLTTFFNGFAVALDSNIATISLYNTSSHLSRH